MGLPPGAWLDMSPREFNNHRKGYIKRLEAQELLYWNRTRYIAWAALAPHAKKGKLDHPTDLFKFDWEQSNIDQEKIKQLEMRFPKTLAEVKSKKWEKVGKRG